MKLFERLRDLEAKFPMGEVVEYSDLLEFDEYLGMLRPQLPKLIAVIDVLQAALEKIKQSGNGLRLEELNGEPYALLVQRYKELEGHSKEALAKARELE